MFGEKWYSSLGWFFGESTLISGGADILGAGEGVNYPPTTTLCPSTGSELNTDPAWASPAGPVPVRPGIDLSFTYGSTCIDIGSGAGVGNIPVLRITPARVISTDSTILLGLMFSKVISFRKFLSLSTFLMI